MQQLIQGEHTLQQAGAIINDEGYKKVFLISGRHFADSTSNDFLKGLDVYHCIKQGPNVKDDEIVQALALYRQYKADVILAVGGGSVIDLAKAILYAETETNAPIPFFIAAPTTCGSGSEATHFAVVYKGMKKQSLVHAQLSPKVVILDPALLYSLPSYQAAATGMDAFSQAVESYWNVFATKESQRYASEAISIWKDNFTGAVEGNKQARENMLQAAHLAGLAINITRTTGPHALSYYLTAYHGIAHGQAVSVFLPVFFLYNAPQPDLYALLEVDNETGAAEMIRQKMKQAGLSVSLSELGIDKNAIIDALLNEVNEERFANNPVAFDREKLKSFILDNL